jgi:hypothetical protein
VRIRKVSSVREMERVIDEMITLGYEVRDRGAETALLKEKTWGSVGVTSGLIIIALIFAYYTLLLSFLLPIAYVVYKHQTAETVEVKVERPMDDAAGPRVEPRAYAPPPEAELPRQAPPPPRAQPQPLQASVTSKVCISCNSINDQNAAYCARCGARI